MESALFDAEDGYYTRHASIAHTLAPIQGVLIANEVLDAFPVHVLVRTTEGVREVFVAEAGGALVETLRSPSSADLRWRFPRSVPVEGRWETSPAAEGWVASLSAALVSGDLVLIDYGGEEAELLRGEGAGTLRGFARHRLASAPPAQPGRHALP